MIFGSIFLELLRRKKLMLRERDSGRIRITASANKLQHSPCRDWFVGLQGDARIQRFIGIVVCQTPKALAVLLLTAIRAIFSSFCKSSEAKAIASPSSCCDHHFPPGNPPLPLISDGHLATCGPIAARSLSGRPFRPRPSGGHHDNTDFGTNCLLLSDNFAISASAEICMLVQLVA